MVKLTNDQLKRLLTATAMATCNVPMQIAAQWSTRAMRAIDNIDLKHVGVNALAYELKHGAGKVEWKKEKADA